MEWNGMSGYPHYVPNKEDCVVLLENILSTLLQFLFPITYRILFIGNDFYTVLPYTFTNTTYRLNRRWFEYRPVVAT